MADSENHPEMTNLRLLAESASRAFSRSAGPLSVYVHVPFCRSRCTYCAFYTGENLRRIPDYLRAVAAEAGLRAGSYRAQAATLYAGGGTPSVLRPADLAFLLETVHRVRGLARDAEISVEVNPGSGADLRALRDAGFNRVSVGVQALDDHVLAFLGRPHTAVQACGAVEAARRAGFGRVSADLLVGIPGLPPARIAEWARILVSAGADHVSVYALEVHPGTELHSRSARGMWTPPDEEEEETQWAAAADALESSGLRLYEVSNFARPGAECRHNIAYWEGRPYEGLGPGAHSYSPLGGLWGIRRWNRPELTAYVEALKRGRPPPSDMERLTRKQALLEALFLWLRRPVPWAEQRWLRFGVDVRTFRKLLEPLVAQGDLDGDLAPTRQGMRRADGLAGWLWERLCSPAGNRRESPATGHVS